MIAAIDDDCQKWGAHKLWLIYGTQGWAPLSVLGRLIEEGPGAGQGSFVYRVPIKDSPPAYVSVNHALLRMAETHVMHKPWLVIHAHYLIRGKAKQKAPQLGLSVAQYWNELQVGHSFILGCSPADVPRGAELYRQNLACA